MIKPINQRIARTDIYVFSRDSDTGAFKYSRPITPEEGREVAGKVNIKGGLGVTEEGVLYSMSTLKGIVANRKLMEQTGGKVWFPTVYEGLLLHDAGLLPKGGLMDFGIAVYDAESPDKEIAQSLTETAKQKGWALPLLLSFKSLDLNEGGKRYGYIPAIVSADGLIQGEDAKKTLEKFTFVGHSGVRRLYRARSGDWSAYWVGNLDDFFNEFCRVGRVSAEGSKKNLKNLVSTQIEQDFNAQRKGLQAKLQELNAQEKECVASAESILQA